MFKRTISLSLLLLIITVPHLFSQESESGSISDLLGFGLDLGLGTETFYENVEVEPGVFSELPVTYQGLNLKPDLGFGKFGVGVDITVHFRFTDEEGSFQFRTADWVPATGATGAETFQNILSLYLPMIRYVRWGTKGEDLFIKAGSIEDATLGNGFIMGNYSNTNFLPDKRLFGLGFDLDGKLFNFPFVGFETFVADLSLLDVLGARLFVRPLSWLNVPILNNLEVGGTFAMDRIPNAHYDFENNENVQGIYMYGVDMFEPIVANKIVTLAAYGDVVWQPRLIDGVTETAFGGMIGLGGKLFGLLPYGLQARFLGENFIPVYFDSTYDLFREVKYRISTEDLGTVTEAKAGWLASLGFSILDDRIVFNASVDSPFVVAAGSLSSIDYTSHPHMRIVLLLKEGLLPGITLSASYDKKNLDLITKAEDMLTDALIGAELNYRTGPAVLTFSYNLRYNPDAGPGEDPWLTTTKLTSSIKLF